MKVPETIHKFSRENGQNEGVYRTWHARKEGSEGKSQEAVKCLVNATQQEIALCILRLLLNKNTWNFQRWPNKHQKGSGLFFFFKFYYYGRFLTCTKVPRIAMRTTTASTVTIHGQYCFISMSIILNLLCSEANSGFIISPLNMSAHISKSKEWETRHLVSSSLGSSLFHLQSFNL